MNEYFHILGLTPTKDKNLIKSSYRTLVKLHHPDNGGDIEKFRLIDNAYKNIINNLDFTDNFIYNENIITIDLVISIKDAYNGNTITYFNKKLNSNIMVNIPSLFEDNNVIVSFSNYKIHHKLIIKEDKVYKKDKLNLIHNIGISSLFAIFGGFLNIKTIDNKDEQIFIPATTQNGYEIKLEKKGFKKDNKFGDMIFKINLVTPILTSEHKEAIRKIHENIKR